MNKQRVIGSTMTASLLLMGLFFILSVNRKHKVETSPITAEITYPVFTTYNDNGQLNTEVHAVVATEQSSSNSVYLTYPHALIHNHSSGHSTWDIRAETGTWDAHQQVAQLSRHVVAQQTTQNKAILTVIKTDHLSYIPKKHLLDTKEAVLLKQPGFQALGTGVTVNLTRKIIHIRRGLQGQYHPAHAAQKNINARRPITP